MCAECHSTTCARTTTPRRDRFATTWAEISVGCEACHGPGSRHVAWAREQRAAAVGKRDDPATGLAVALRRAARRRLDARSRDRHAHAQTRAAARCAREVETCGALPRAARPARRRLGAGPAARRHAPVALLDARALLRRRADARRGLRLRLVPAEPDVRARASPAATATSRTAPKLRADGERRLPAVPRRRASSTRRRITITQRRRRRRAASSATCRRAPTWWSTRATTTASASRGPTSRPRSARRTPATTATPTRPPAWAAAAIERWHGPERKGFQTYAKAFHAAWNGGADAARLLGEIAVGSQRAARSPARARSPSSGPFSRQATSSSLAPDSPTPIRWCASARSRCSTAHRRTASGRCCRRCCRIPSRGVRIRAVALLADVPAAEQPGADRDRFDRAAAEFVAAQRLNADRPEARTTLGSFLARHRPRCRGRSRIPGGAAARPDVRAGGGEPRRPLSAARARCRWRGGVAGGARRLGRQCGTAPCARPGADSHQAARRRTRRAASRFAARARARPLCLRVRRRACIRRTAPATR